MKIFSKTKLKKAGFTLVETLVAIAILVLAIVGPLTIAANSLRSAYYASDQVTAFYLAQEGVEYMRYLRDFNFIAQDPNRAWDQDIGQCKGATTLCRLDANSIFSSTPGIATLSTCAVLTDCRVQVDPNGYYRQVDPSNNSFAQTNFYRTISVTTISPSEDRIVVNVYWTTGNLKSPNNFQIAENIFNWDNVATGLSTGAPPVVPTASLDASPLYSFKPNNSNVSVTYTWSSSNADTFTSSVSNTCSATNPISNTSSGSSAKTYHVSNATGDCYYTTTYTATNSSSGQSATSSVTVEIDDSSL